MSRKSKSRKASLEIDPLVSIPHLFFRFFYAQLSLFRVLRELGPAREKRVHKKTSLARFLPSVRKKRAIEARQARLLVAARRAFFEEFGTLDQSAVEWERLQSEHKIFTVTHRGDTYIPSFQFDEERKPRPAIEKVIQILGKNTSDWGLALWFTAASVRLDGKRPVDLLSSHPEEVVQAAEQEAAELVF